MARSNMTTEQGIEAIRLGDPDRGRTLLQQAVLENPNDEQAWLWLSTIASTTAQQLDCLRHVLEINPFNHAARRDLAAIPPRFHYDAPATTAGTPGTKAAPAVQRPATTAWGTTPSVASVIPVATTQQALRNDTVIANSSVPAAKSPSASSGASTATGGTQSIPAIIIPAPTLLEPLDERPRDPDYSPVQAVAARKFAQGVVRKKGPSAPHLAGIALGLLAFALIIVMILALLIDTAPERGEESAQPTAAPNGAAAVPRATTTLDPGGRSFGSEATAVGGAHGPLNVPGTAFVDGRVIDADPPWTLAVIWVWAEPFETSHVQCKLPHGSAVLLLETQAAPDGRHSVHVQRRECSGWVSADLLSPTAVPPIGPVKNNDDAPTEK